MKKLAIGILLLSGCSHYKPVMDSWMDHHRDQLIRSWGPPSATSTLSDGGEVLQYQRVSQRSNSNMLFPVAVPGAASPLFIGGGGGVVTDMCAQTFYTNPHGVINSWRVEGKCGLP